MLEFIQNNMLLCIVKVTRAIRTCFKKADFRSPCVKILANTGVLAAFLPRLNKNPLFSKSTTAKRGDFEGFLFRSGEGMLTPCEHERGKKH